MLTMSTKVNCQYLSNDFDDVRKAVLICKQCSFSILSHPIRTNMHQTTQLEDLRTWSYFAPPGTRTHTVRGWVVTNQIFISLDHGRTPIVCIWNVTNAAHKAYTALKVQWQFQESSLQTSMILIWESYMIGNAELFSFIFKPPVNLRW